MSNDAKFFMFLCGCVVIIVVAISGYQSFANYQTTIRFKECISAGYEWTKEPNAIEFSCKKVPK